MDTQVDPKDRLIDRARELGPVWCAVRWLTAIPLFVVVPLSIIVPDGGLGFLFWWEWITLRPFVSKPTSAYVAPSRGWDTVPRNSTGRTMTALRPTGKILIGEVAHEARSEGGWIDAECDVLVVGSDANGLIVRAHTRNLELGHKTRGDKPMG